MKLQKLLLKKICQKHKTDASAKMPREGVFVFIIRTIK